MFHFPPDTQYLLITVILMEAQQYARMDSAGLFVIFDGALDMVGDLFNAGEEPRFVGISMV